MLTVLCIDDDRPTLELRESVLRAEGFHVLTANTGADGIALAAVHKCDLVVLDYVLPDMNGEGVAGVIRQQSPDVPIVLCSGYGDIPESVFKLVDAFVTKGDVPEFLVMTIKSLIDRKKPLRRQRPLDRTG